MRRILTFSLFVFCVFVVYGTAQCDSVKVFFPLNKAVFDSELDNNASSMEKFIDGIVVSNNAGTLDSIVVYGYASPDGPFIKNDRLSIERCNNIADYISRNSGIALNDIRKAPGCIAWDGLRSLVIENIHIPSREAVLGVLDEYLPDATTDQSKSDQCRKEIMAIDNGFAYKWMLSHIFPKLRYSLIIAISTPQDCLNLQADSEQPENNSQITSAEDSVLLPVDSALHCNNIISIPSYTDPETSESLPPLHRLALKTNFLYYAALLPNLEIEWRVNNKWSVALEGAVAWWGHYSKERSYRLAIVSPEVRRWVWTRTPWHGLYAGLFAGGALYDFEKGSPGYRGEAVMGGLSVGYMWPISRNLSLEAGIGAGYMYTRYKEYKPIGGHHVYQRTKDLNYFGPLKVKLSLVWRFWNINRHDNAVKLNDSTL